MVVRVIGLTRFIMGFVLSLGGLAFATLFRYMMDAPLADGPDYINRVGFPFIAWVKIGFPSVTHLNYVLLLCDGAIWIALCTVTGLYFKRVQIPRF